MVNKKTKIILTSILLLVVLIALFALYLIENPDETNYFKCIFEFDFGRYVHGEIMVDFVQDVTKGEVDALLSSYGLSSYEIRYPISNDYRVDFTGDTKGFLEYLNQNGFTSQEHRNPRLFLFTAEESINCKIAKDIFYSYPDVSVTYTHCFGHVWGVVEVKKGTEKRWICKLRKSDIVKDTRLNGITSINQGLVYVEFT